MTFLQTGSRYTYTANLPAIIEQIPPGHYRVGFDRESGFFLDRVPSMTVPGRVYGAVDARAERIWSTYGARPGSTGVLLSGEKGSGKTMLARKLCVRAENEGQPVLIVDQGSNVEHPGFSHLLGAMSFPFVALFDEFEKNFQQVKDQSCLLSLMDGVSPGHRLLILTTNERDKISPFMIDRPGRIYYAFEYGGVEEEVVREYFTDQGLPLADAERLVAMQGLTATLSFDALQAIAEEMKRYDVGVEEAVRDLNVMRVRPAFVASLSLVMDDGTVVPTRNKINYHPDGEYDEYVRLSRLPGPNAGRLVPLFEKHQDEDGDIEISISAGTLSGYDRTLGGLVHATEYEGVRALITRP